MKLKEIHRTATFTWSPSKNGPLMLASGTVAGALDESFSSESQLEIWTPDFMDSAEYDLGGVEQKGPLGSVTTSSRCVAEMSIYNAWAEGDADLIVCRGGCQTLVVPRVSWLPAWKTENLVFGTQRKLSRALGAWFSSYFVCLVL